MLPSLVITTTSFLLISCSFSLTSSFSPASVVSYPSSSSNMFREDHRNNNKAILLQQQPRILLLQQSNRRGSVLLQAKASKKKKKKGGGGGGGMKGFGSPVVAAATKKSSGGSTSTTKVDIDRSKPARMFYEFLERKNAGDNLKRCTLGYFPLPNNDGALRGVVATRDIKKGEVMIRIPYELAVNLGPEGEDPTGPAVTFLRDYCSTMLSNDESSSSKAHGYDRKTYYDMLPPFQGSDCLGSTDFFSEEALDALQYPLIAEETERRRKRTKQRFLRDIIGNNVYDYDDDDDDSEKKDVPQWIDNGTSSTTASITEEHLQWAVWIVTSRVLTVQGDAEEGRSYKLLIPFLDMCNHDRNSPHVLTGRAVPGGELKVVAGSNVKVGEQINICYGGGVAGNDRFVQDYGFLDYHAEGYDLVAKQLLGKRRIQEGASKGKSMPMADQERSLEALRATTTKEDEELLLQLQTTASDDADNKNRPAIRSALEFRLGVKKALAKYVIMP